jgi:carotenoid 1,2-hydratase
VFSPYYAAARRRGPTAAAGHCAFNVVLHSGARRCWSMTERGATSLQRTPDRLGIGPSHIRWDGGALRFGIDERTFPWPGRIRGEIRFFPDGPSAPRQLLDERGAHTWHPLAPRGRVEVDFAQPRLQWNGEGYFDSNRGTEPLERAFRHWHWSRWSMDDGTLLQYDVERRNADPLALLLRQRGAGFEPLPPLQLQSLPASRWGIARSAPADEGHRPEVLQTLVDAPFYARSLVSSRFEGKPVIGFHESLSLDRFDSRWVQCLLPFRMPRHAVARRDWPPTR